MNIWKDINPERVTPEKFIACIEISAGSKTKYELDKETGMLILDRILYTATHYPANYGFIPGTLSDDGDPLDVLVLCSQRLLPNTLVKCFPIGVLTMIDDELLDQKIIAIPSRDPGLNSYRDIGDLPAHTFEEITNFFEIYKILEKIATSVTEIKGVDEAKLAISACVEKFRSNSHPL